MDTAVSLHQCNSDLGRVVVVVVVVEVKVIMRMEGIGK
jgi:hypothetical protein